MKNVFNEVCIDVEEQDSLIETMGNTHFLKYNGRFVHSGCGGTVMSSLTTLSYICAACATRWLAYQINLVEKQNRGELIDYDEIDASRSRVRKEVEDSRKRWRRKRSVEALDALEADARRFNIR